MSNLAVNNNPVPFERKNTELTLWDDEPTLLEIREVFKKNLTEGEFKTFLQIGKATGLNPFLKEIWAVKYDEKKPAQIFIGRDGYRKCAQRNAQYDIHHADAVYSNDVFEVRNGNPIHRYGTLDRGKLIGAYSTVKKKSSTEQFFVFVDLKEYNKGQSCWVSMPATMIKKVAEAQVLRMAFQDVFGGTYSEEENWEKDKNQKSSETNARIIEHKNHEEFTTLENNHEGKLNHDLEQIHLSEDLKDLECVFKAAYKFWITQKDKESIRKLIEAKDDRKKIIEQIIEVKLDLEVLKSTDEKTGEIHDYAPSV